MFSIYFVDFFSTLSGRGLCGAALAPAAPGGARAPGPASGPGLLPVPLAPSDLLAGPAPALGDFGGGGPARSCCDARQFENNPPDRPGGFCGGALDFGLGGGAGREPPGLPAEDRGGGSECALFGLLAFLADSPALALLSPGGGGGFGAVCFLCAGVLVPSLAWLSDGAEGPLLDGLRLFGVPDAFGEASPNLLVPVEAVRPSLWLLARDPGDDGCGGHAKSVLLPPPRPSSACQEDVKLVLKALVEEDCQDVELSLKLSSQVVSCVDLVSVLSLLVILETFSDLLPPLDVVPRTYGARPSTSVQACLASGRSLL